MRYAFTFVLTLAVHLAVSGQQTDVPVVQFQSILIQTNPATAGLNYKRAANALFHLDKSHHGKTEVSANFNYAVRPDSAHYGIGISLMNDNRYTFVRTRTLLVHSAYYFRLGTSSILSLGVSGGIRFHRYDYFWIEEHTPGDPLLPSNERQARFQANAGIAYHRKNLNTGFSVTQLNSPKFRKSDASDYSPEFQVAPDYWFFADYTFQLPGRLELKPQIQIVTDAHSYLAYTSLVATYNKKIWVGANYAYDSYLGGMIGIDIRQKFRIGAGYSVRSSDPGKIYSRMYEVSLAYLLKQ